VLTARLAQVDDLALDHLVIGVDDLLVGVGCTRCPIWNT
jgi:hypothetical protein